MFRRPLLTQAIRLSLTSAVAISAAFSTTAAAQQANSAEQVERVQITGSRIFREGAISQAPVTAISGKDLMETGALNIGEALNELPALASTFSMANSGNYIGTAGLNLLDLRGMGASRTLVLVNGKRHVSSSAGSASVDTNTIPTAWVESVEIITGGASAIYGADAVTGVVNFKLKKDIQGLDVSATAGKANDNPYHNEKFTFSYGQDIADGDGNLAFAAEFASQNNINALDRSQTRTPYAAVPNPLNKDKKDANGNTIHDGIPDQLVTANTGYYDSLNQGNFFLNDQWYLFNDDSSVRLQNLGTAYPSRGICTNCDFINLREYQDLQPQFDRYNLNLKADYDLSSDLNLSASAKHVVSKGNAENQPSYFYAEDSLEIKADNAYMTNSLRQLMTNNGVSEIYVARYNKDAGQRIEKNTRTTNQFNLVLSGQLNDDWNFESFATHGETKLEQVNLNNLIKKNFFQSIDAVKDANGNIVCRDEQARKAGCVPTSIFGQTAINAQARQWFNTTSISESKIEQQVAGFNLANGALLELPAGNLGVAAGVEYRHEQSDSMPDAFSATGATFLNAIQETHGKFNVKEVFAETTIPLLTDLPYVQDLSLNAAVRYADYSTIGDATSWKTGLDWTLTDELRFRGTYSVALRAPNIGELFSPLSQDFFTVNDPCDVKFNQSATRVKNCAALTIPADFVATSTGASIDGLSGGNSALKPEESDSYTLGFVYQPELVENLTLTVDYWSIDIEDAIGEVSGQNILNKCVDSATGLNQQFCSLVRRDANKQIRFITSTSQNVAAQTAEGVDFEVGYDFDALGGNFKTKLIGTYLDSRKSYSFQNSPSEFEENAGTEGEAIWQENFSLAYRYDAWTATWKTRHLSGVSLYNVQQLAINPDPSDQMAYGSYFISDISLGYQFGNGVNWTVGIDNLFDRDLPGVATGTSTGSASYDNIGQFFYTTVSFKM
jgi:outer membrane receptor protein involved in Fe transport